MLHANEKALDKFLLIIQQNIFLEFSGKKTNFSRDSQPLEVIPQCLKKRIKGSPIIIVKSKKQRNRYLLCVLSRITTLTQ